MIAVVTGAGRGIGRAIALELARRGCDLALLGRDVRADQTVASTAKDVVRSGRRAMALRCDVTVASELESVASRVLAELGVPRVVVSNAGVVHRALVREMTEQQWGEVIDVNL